MAQGDAPLQVRTLGSFHLGGAFMHVSGTQQVQMTPVAGALPINLDAAGVFPYGQMYVQFTRLHRPRSPHPLFLWHGGGLTGACWESTPDGRPGWQTRFLRRGLDVFNCDAVERGRAGWSRFPQIYPGEPVFMPQHAAWALYRIGEAGAYVEQPQLRRVHAGSRFPAAAFDAFTRQIVPRWTCNDSLIQAAYDALLAREGPCLLVAHSQGAGFALRAASAAPDRVKALVLVEPGGNPLDDAQMRALAAVPVLIVWGDFIASVPFWAQAFRQAQELAQALERLGGDVCVLDLPARGITGNSHLPMMDTNSDAVADMVCDWFIRKGLLEQERGDA
jgi:pimeloyl-ACP methyl ester carboxylesterase